MATVPSASPRPSLSLMRSPPSSRTSLEQTYNAAAGGAPSLSRISTVVSSAAATTTATASANNAAAAALPAAARRNRAALRDYYGIKSPTAGPPDSVASPTGRGSESADGSQALLLGHQAGLPGLISRLDALDREGFDAGSFVRQVLETEKLEGLLALENELVGEVRTLDGERKALVYDNYSKLISATDTIKKVCIQHCTKAEWRLTAWSRCDPIWTRLLLQHLRLPRQSHT